MGDHDGVEGVIKIAWRAHPIDGYQLARNLRGRASTAKLVLIALTGYGQPEDVQRARLAAFDHHLVKPVEPDAVHALIGVPASGEREP
jgi:CheY-like chemotaxis protein